MGIGDSAINAAIQQNAAAGLGTTSGKSAGEDVTASGFDAFKGDYGSVPRYTAGGALNNLDGVVAGIVNTDG